MFQAQKPENDKTTRPTSKEPTEAESAAEPEDPGDGAGAGDRTLAEPIPVSGATGVEPGEDPSDGERAAKPY